MFIINITINKIEYQDLPSLVLLQVLALRSRALSGVAADTDINNLAPSTIETLPPGGTTQGGPKVLALFKFMSDGPLRILTLSLKAAVPDGYRTTSTMMAQNYGRRDSLQPNESRM